MESLKRRIRTFLSVTVRCENAVLKEAKGRITNSINLRTVSPEFVKGSLTFKLIRPPQKLA